MCPGFLRGEDPNNNSSVDLGLIELWCYPLSSNSPAPNLKFTECILELALETSVVTHMEMRELDTLSSAGSKFTL